MGLPRSTYYDTPATEADTEIVARITAICEEFEAYGYRRVGAELRHQGIVVNGKKIRRLMRQHDLQPKRRRRFIATTDSDHDSPIFSNRAKDVTADRPNQLWVADITYVAAMPPLAQLRRLCRSSILDAWSRLRRWLCASAAGDSIDAAHLGSAQGRWHPVMATAAKVAVDTGTRLPAHAPPSTEFWRAPRIAPVYAAADYRKLLAKHGLIGSMSRRGNPYENAMAESFMKTLKVEAVCLSSKAWASRTQAQSWSIGSAPRRASP